MLFREQVARLDVLSDAEFGCIDPMDLEPILVRPTALAMVELGCHMLPRSPCVPSWLTDSPDQRHKKLATMAATGLRRR